MKSLVQPEIVRRMKALFFSFTLIGACQPAVHGAAGTVFLWSWSAETVTNVPAGLTNVVSVAAGLAHAMALRDDGTVVAWGIDSGYGETQVPAGLTNVVSISAGWDFSMALRRDGNVVTWGATYFTKPPPD